MDPDRAELIILKAHWVDKPQGRLIKEHRVVHETSMPEMLPWCFLSVSQKTPS